MRTFTNEKITQLLSAEKEDNGWILTVLFEPLHVAICFQVPLVHPVNEGSLLVCIMGRAPNQSWFTKLLQRENWRSSCWWDSYSSYESRQNRNVFLPHWHMHTRPKEFQWHAPGQNSPLLRADLSAILLGVGCWGSQMPGSEKLMPTSAQSPSHMWAFIRWWSCLKGDFIPQGTNNVV
jgi:hypothetical protein